MIILHDPKSRIQHSAEIVDAISQSKTKRAFHSNVFKVKVNINTTLENIQQELISTFNVMSFTIHCDWWQIHPWNYSEESTKHLHVWWRLWSITNIFTEVIDGTVCPWVQMKTSRHLTKIAGVQFHVINSFRPYSLLALSSQVRQEPSFWPPSNHENVRAPKSGWSLNERCRDEHMYIR